MRYNSDCLVASAKRVMSLHEPHRKMSKSHQDTRSRIHINDDPAAVRDKIRLALTDSVTGVSYDPVNRPGVSNLLTIMSYLDRGGRTPEELATGFKAMSMQDFKDGVSSTISERLAEIRERYNHLMMADMTGFLDNIADEGAVEARRQAEVTMTAVRQVVGFRSYSRS